MHINIYYPFAPLDSPWLRCWTTDRGLDPVGNLPPGSSEVDVQFLIRILRIFECQSWRVNFWKAK